MFVCLFVNVCLFVCLCRSIAHSKLDTKVHQLVHPLPPLSPPSLHLVSSLSCVCVAQKDSVPAHCFVEKVYCGLQAVSMPTDEDELQQFLAGSPSEGQRSSDDGSKKSKVDAVMSLQVKIGENCHDCSLIF